MIRGKSGKAVIIIILAVTMVVLIAGIAVVVFKPFGQAKGHGKAKVDKGPAVMVSLGEFVVNLADTTQIRYLKADVVLEMHGVKAAGGHGEGADETTPRTRDAVICVMSSKKFSELIKPGGKEKLKEDIIKAVNEHLEEGETTDVFFNEFAMQ